MNVIQMCRLLLEHGCEVNYLSKTGESPLHILTKKGRFEAAMVLLTHGANANLKGQDGNTALHLAMKVVLERWIWHGSQKLSNALNQMPSRSVYLKTTMFDFVHQLDHIELIKALIVFGADVEIHNDLGETPGLIAARTSKGKRLRRCKRS